jgi:hypothetical protein
MVYRLLAAPVVLTIVAGIANSQENASQGYAQATYLKVAPGKNVALIEH